MLFLNVSFYSDTQKDEPSELQDKVNVDVGKNEQSEEEPDDDESAVEEPNEVSEKDENDITETDQNSPVNRRRYYRRRY